jgi:EAL domain-containing protein (putative c-di-GMP-specific phosphodiesterase class I)
MIRAIGNKSNHNLEGKILKKNESIEKKQLQWCLEYVTDEDREWQVTIDSVPFVIGRADDCNLKLTDRHVSRYHSEIRISGDLLWIRDLKSTNGTFINQNKIEDSQLLETKDIISIGKYKFRVKSISSSLAGTNLDNIDATLFEERMDLDFYSFEPRFRRLLRKRNVIPHFQPLLRFSDMAKVGYEILGRVGDESLPSSLDELFDMAKRLGYASELSSLFREVGVEIGKDLPGSPILFVNSSMFEISDIDTLLASMQRICDIAPTNKIVLEINEKAIADKNELPMLRSALKKMDIGLAFDDFGVGQTRLVELSKTPPDYLKFDISLIREIHLAPKRLHQMILTFIKASHDLDIFTLAEGIECSEESEVCQKLGFDFGQGYFFGEPAPINEIKVKYQDKPYDQS